MIGQQKLLTRIDKLIEGKRFPHFSIFIGAAGSGRKTIAKYAADAIQYGKWDTETFESYGCGIDDIRQLIHECNSKAPNICMKFLIPDADGMSVQAKNALLKIAEEPPKNVYIMMTLEDINNTLDTIKSRAATFALDPYTVPQLQEYAKSKKYKELDIIKDICETPGEVDLLCSYKVQDFYDFVVKTVDNIATTNGANVFKLAQKLKLKDNEEGYDLKLFFRMFIKICSERYMDDPTYIAGVTVTSQYLKDLRIKGISKQGVVDLWILDIRKEWI